MLLGQFQTSARPYIVQAGLTSGVQGHSGAEVPPATRSADFSAIHNEVDRGSNPRYTHKSAATPH